MCCHIHWDILKEIDIAKEFVQRNEMRRLAIRKLAESQHIDLCVDTSKQAIAPPSAFSMCL